MKALSMGYMLLLLCYCQGFAKGLALFLIGHLACGEMLTTMFIISHVAEGVAFAKKNQPNHDKANTSTPPTTAQGARPIENLIKKHPAVSPLVPLNDWAAVQFQTSVNWSSGSWLWNHFSGGLLHQIEHHLFPRICHTNYAYIQDVVQTTCEEYGVPYCSKLSLLTAYFKMLKHLRQMGNGASCASLHANKSKDN